MTDTVCKADYRITEDHKIRTKIYSILIIYYRPFKMSAGCRSKMTTRGESHNANMIWIDIPFFRSLSHYLNSSLCILQRTDFFVDHALVIRNPVFYYKCCNTHLIKFFGDIITLMTGRYNMITTTRDYDHSSSGGLFSRR